MSQKSDKSPPAKGIFKGFTSKRHKGKKRKSFKEKKQKIPSSETRKRGAKRGKKKPLRALGGIMINGIANLLIYKI